MKTILITLVTLLLFISLYGKSFSQDEEPLAFGELYFQNFSSSGRTITIKVYPVSMVFNGDRENGYRYDLRAVNEFGGEFCSIITLMGEIQMIMSFNYPPVLDR